jgi:hypothetical protein
MNDLTIREQIHLISANHWAVEKVRLWELFDDFTGIEQIIRFRSDISRALERRMAENDHVHLFNLPDQVNAPLIEQYRNWKASKALTAIISGEWGVIQHSSLKVVDVLEMKNMKRPEILENNLDELSVPWKWRLYQWLWSDFYPNSDILQHNEFLFRNIATTNETI